MKLELPTKPDPENGSGVFWRYKDFLCLQKALQTGIG